MSENVFLCGCGGFLKLSHKDDVGTEWFKCEACNKQVTRLELERNRAKTLEVLQIEHKELTKPLTVEELREILGTTVKYDDPNKVITFLCMLLTYTEEDQINLGYLAESTTGKSYIPLELASYFPKEDVVELGYTSPTAFFHDYGELETDPQDRRDIPEEKKVKRIRIDLWHKILIFMDQPHDLLLQRLRSFLSHDRKEILLKITDRRERAGLRTKNVVLVGPPTVIFCSAKFNMQDQEKTRLLLLSPEISQEKLRDTVALKIERESDREVFRKRMMDNPQRKMLVTRVWSIKRENIKQVTIPLELRQQIYDKYIKDHKFLKPRDQRDITKLLAIMKGHALLNYGHREKNGDSLIIKVEDVQAGFQLYYQVSEANELGLSPEIYDIYKKLETHFENSENGLLRKDVQKYYFQTFHKVLGGKACIEILNAWITAGLVIEQPDPNDRRFMRYIPYECGVDTANQQKEEATPQ